MSCASRFAGEQRKSFHAKVAKNAKGLSELVNSGMSFKMIYRPALSLIPCRASFGHMISRTQILLNSLPFTLPCDLCARCVKNSLLER